MLAEIAVEVQSIDDSIIDYNQSSLHVMHLSMYPIY